MFDIVRREPRLGWGMLNLRDEMNKLFGNFFDDLDWRVSYWTPSIDIVEEDDKLRLTAELPGVDKKDVKINIQNNVLTIEGEKRQQNEDKKDNSHYSERFYGKFRRSFTLPAEVESEKVDAEYRDGVLTVTLPKSEKVKPRLIKIK